jgi:hypothetical protein
MSSLKQTQIRTRRLPSKNLAYLPLARAQLLELPFSHEHSFFYADFKTLTPHAMGAGFVTAGLKREEF